jgi:hypothetical protein
MDNHNNANNLQGYGRSIQNMMPPPISNYMAVHVDTIPKVMNHVLFLLTVSNFFLLIKSMSVSFMTFIVASLLALQTMVAVMILNNNQINLAPRSLEPTEFIVGLCLGICVGGGILAFFVSVSFSRAFSLCKYAAVHYTPEDLQHSCGNLTKNRLWSMWWWSSIIFWLDIFLAFLVAAGREEITHTQQQQYNSIDSSERSSVSSLTSADQYNIQPPQFQQHQQQQSSPTSFQQNPQKQQQQQQQQQQQHQNHQSNNPLGGYGDFTIQPDTSNSSGAKVMSI